MLKVLAWPIAIYVGDYSTFVWLAIIQTGLTVSMSHLLAKRRFCLKWNWAVAKRAFNFGWPLLLNSILIYAALQGDRIILSRAYTKTDLGVFSIAVGMVMSIAGLVIGPLSSVSLPMLSSYKDNRNQHDGAFRILVGIHAAVALLLGILFVTVGPWLGMLIYGNKFALATTVIGWIGIMRVFRILRGSHATYAMSLGDTRQMLMTNVVRQIALGIAIYVAWRGLPIEWIAIAGAIGELCSFLFSIGWLKVRHSVSVRISVGPAIIVFAVLSIATLAGRAALSNGSPLAASISFLLLTMISVVVLLLFLEDLRIQVVETVSAVARRVFRRPCSETPRA